MLEADVEVDRREFRLSAAFSVAAGERLALFGPSGAGKTTILETIAGLLEPVRGTVVLDGRVLTRTAPPCRHVPPWQRRVGLLRQDPALFPHLSVRQNLGYAPAPGTTARDHQDRRAAGPGRDAGRPPGPAVRRAGAPGGRAGGLPLVRPPAARRSAGNGRRRAPGPGGGGRAGRGLVPVRLRQQPRAGQDFAFTVLDPPCFGPDGTRVSRPEEVPT